MKKLLITILMLTAGFVFANAQLNKAIIDTLDPLIIKGETLDRAIFALKPADPSGEKEEDNFLLDFFSYLKKMELKHPNALCLNKKKELLARLLDISESFKRAEELGQAANVRQVYAIICDKVQYITDNILMPG
jgi:hypothetical protein